MTALEQWRHEQREHVTLQSDAALTAYLTSRDPDTVRLDHTAHMTPVEARMLANGSTP